MERARREGNERRKKLRGEKEKGRENGNVVGICVVVGFRGIYALGY